MSAEDVTVPIPTLSARRRKLVAVSRVLFLTCAFPTLACFTNMQAGSRSEVGKRAKASIFEENPAETNEDVVGQLVEFAPRKSFLFFTPVSKTWRAAWGQAPARETVTSQVSPDSSVSSCWRASNAASRGAVRRYAPPSLHKGYWLCCSARARTAVCGTERPAVRPRE